MKMLEPFHRLMRRLLPVDPDTDDRAGAGPFHFDSPLWWFLKDAATIHDNAYEAIRRGEEYYFDDGDTLSSLEEADLWFRAAVQQRILQAVDEITPAQKRWGLLVGGLAYPVIRLRNILRGER